MFFTTKQLEAAAANQRKDAAFWSNPERVAQWERDMREYEEFCAKFGKPE